jgi:uncharacterized cysteine cluster protein YcgN (CxxCxxCC family)
MLMTSPLLALNPQEWEDLCDGCGRCCLVKLEDEDTGELHYTNVACEYLDMDSCRCTDYANRSAINPRCMQLSPDNLDILSLMPDTCAYRLVHEGRSIDTEPRELSVSGVVVSEAYIHEDQLPEHIIEWVSAGKKPC